MLALKNEEIGKGATENAIKNATNFLKLGVSEELVAKGTGLPVEKVLEIKKNILH